MRVLVVGGGAREHAIIWKLKQSPNVTEIIAAPGNPGIAELATCVDVAETSIEKLADLAVVQKIDLTVVGSEHAIHNGIVDYFNHRRLRIFGPSREAARIAWSRYFAKELMLKKKIPTARYVAFEREDLARAYVDSRKLPFVVKPGGPSGGLGVTIARSREEARQAIHNLFSGKYWQGIRTVIIEDYLEGQEIALDIICDGNKAVTMEPAYCQRQLLDDDQGPITQGMGAYAPCSYVEEKMLFQIVSEIVDPLIKALSDASTPYCGALRINLSIDDQGINKGNPRVISFGSMLGTLESQVLLPLLEEDLFEIFWSVTENNLAHFFTAGLRFAPYSSLAIVFTAPGYPENTQLGARISGLDTIETKQTVRIEKQVIENTKPLTVNARTLLFHEGTRQPASISSFASANSSASGSASLETASLETASGIVMTLVSVAESLLDSKVAAYELAKQIEFEGMHYRKDIGVRGLGE